jgi:predicted XRE-type DNA-binding protein
MVGRPFTRRLTDQNLNPIAQTNHIDNWATYRPYFSSTTGKTTLQPTRCFLFFFPPHFFKNNFSQPAFGTFGFARHTSRPFAKPKEPNFSQRTGNGIIYSVIFANICQDNNFIMATQLGDKIRELRTKQNLLLRQVASKLDVDTSIISKMERGERPIKQEQIAILADILKADKEELQTLWLADQLYNVIEGQPMADEALKSVSKKIKRGK